MGRGSEGCSTSPTLPQRRLHQSAFPAHVHLAGVALFQRRHHPAHVLDRGCSQLNDQRVDRGPCLRLVHLRGEEAFDDGQLGARSEAHTSELQSLMRISYAVFCLRKKKTYKNSVLRFFDTEHGTMFTLTLVLFTLTATQEFQSL